MKSCNLWATMIIQAQSPASSQSAFIGAVREQAQPLQKTELFLSNYISQFPVEVVRRASSGLTRLPSQKRRPGARSARSSPPSSPIATMTLSPCSATCGICASVPAGKPRPRVPMGFSKSTQASARGGEYLQKLADPPGIPPIYHGARSRSKRRYGITSSLDHKSTVAPFNFDCRSVYCGGDFPMRRVTRG